MSVWRPLSKAQIDQRSAAGRTGSRRTNAKRKTGRAAEAAHYAYDLGLSLSSVARTFGVAVQSVAWAWQRYYPGVPGLVKHRRPMSERQHPEDEVTL